jgi:hypothetical protein
MGAAIAPRQHTRGDAGVNIVTVAGIDEQSIAQRMDKLPVFQAIRPFQCQREAMAGIQTSAAGY